MDLKFYKSTSNTVQVLRDGEVVGVINRSIYEPSAGILSDEPLLDEHYSSEELRAIADMMDEIRKY